MKKRSIGVSGTDEVFCFQVVNQGTENANEDHRPDRRAFFIGRQVQWRR